MGCGSSRLNFCNHGSTVPPNVRPLLQQRFDNMKKRLQSRGRAHPYKKDLLNKDGEEEEEEEEGPSHILSSKNSSLSSIDERISCVTAEGSKGDLGLSRIDSFMSTNEEVFENNNNEEDDENENDGFDERRIIRRDDFNDCPGSPSFRVYCTENDKNRGAYEEKFHLENGLVEESPNEEEETQKVEAKTPKKGKRRKSFRNVIPSGGKIKNLLNVNSCTPRGKSTKSIS